MTMLSCEVTPGSENLLRSLSFFIIFLVLVLSNRRLRLSFEILFGDFLISSRSLDLCSLYMFLVVKKVYSHYRFIQTYVNRHQSL